MRLLVLAFLACVSAFDPELYNGYQVLEVVPEHEYQLTRLRQIAETSHMDFWQEPVAIERAVQVLVPPTESLPLIETFQSLGLGHRVHVQDVAQNLRDSWASILKHGQPGERVWDYGTFNDFDDFMAELDSLAADCPAGFTCEVSDIGSTVGGRPLRLMKISNGTPRRAFWVDSQIHAREWLAGSTVMLCLNNLIRNYGVDPDATALMDGFEWYFLPVMNPDGYSYTWTNDRYWRKNRSPNSGSTCVGTDLNRNYPYLWGNPGASPLPCSDTYRGAGAASEMETQAVMAYATGTVADNLNGWLTVHTYGQYILYPYGDCSVPSDNADQIRNNGLMCTAIEDTYNTNWDCGNSCAVLYETSGGTNDWAKGTANVKYAYVPELRGNDFVVNDNQIQPAYQEFWNGLVAFVNDAAANQ